MFKYSFADTLLIYNQNPNAQAVASYNNWAKIGRGVMKNPSTIHIPSSKDENQSLKLYTLSDTYGKSFNIVEQNYSIPDEAKVALISSFGVELSRENTLENFDANFKWCIEQRVMEIFDDKVIELLAKDERIIPSQLETLTDEDFNLLVRESIGYTTCQRFGVQKGIYGNDDLSFNNLEMFSNPVSAIILGKLNQLLVEDVITHTSKNLIQIKNEISNNLERMTNNERIERVRGTGIHQESGDASQRRPTEMVLRADPTSKSDVLHGEIDRSDVGTARGNDTGLREQPILPNNHVEGNQDGGAGELGNSRGGVGQPPSEIHEGTAGFGAVSNLQEGLEERESNGSISELRQEMDEFYGESPSQTNDSIEADEATQHTRGRHGVDGHKPRLHGNLRGHGMASGGGSLADDGRFRESVSTGESQTLFP